VEAVKPVERRWTLTELIDEAYIPYCRHKWKESTAETTEDRIQYHIVRDLGKMEIRNINREMLQRYLERKTKRDSPTVWCTTCAGISAQSYALPFRTG
jgi:hypothetical protein